MIVLDILLCTHFCRLTTPSLPCTKHHMELISSQLLLTSHQISPSIRHLVRQTTSHLIQQTSSQHQQSHQLQSSPLLTMKGRELRMSRLAQYVGGGWGGHYHCQCWVLSILYGVLSHQTALSSSTLFCLSSVLSGNQLLCLCIRSNNPSSVIGTTELCMSPVQLSTFIHCLWSSSGWSVDYV